MTLPIAKARGFTVPSDNIKVKLIIEYKKEAGLTSRLLFRYFD